MENRDWLFFLVLVAAIWMAFGAYVTASVAKAETAALRQQFESLRYPTDELSELTERIEALESEAAGDDDDGSDDPYTWLPRRMREIEDRKKKEG